MNATIDLPTELRAPARTGRRTVFRVSPMRIVVLYALAMAWVESAVVFYMRSMIDRLVPYQANPLPLAGGFGFAEVVREAATLVMLLTVGTLAGRTWRSRAGYTLLAFGIWDIAYYLWLVPLTAWPTSFGDWDILFLIPLPWWGPVWAPMSIAALMIVFGATVARHDTPERPLWPGGRAISAAVFGGLLALYVFMADALQLVLSGGGLTDLRDLLPQWFNWPLFLVALALMAVPVVEVVMRARRRTSANALSSSAPREVTTTAMGPSLSPHPGPLPWGEGASQPALELHERVVHAEGGVRFSLFPGERAGVRGNGAPAPSRDQSQASTPA